MLILGGGVLFALGFALGRNENAKTPVAAAGEEQSVMVASKPAPEPSLPEARAAMRKAALLSDQNPDAYRATYLNKRYRVTGKIENVIGTVRRDIYSGPGFEVVLESWTLRGSKYPKISEPHLALIDLPRSTQLAVRPGQQIDASCLLEEWMNFRYCRLNRPIGK
jgi:hypothetical protein